jgi:hypothetical protein
MSETDSFVERLTIHLTNSYNLPKDTIKLIELQKQIAITTKNLLQNPNQFKVYNIYFLYKKRVLIGTKSGVTFTHSFELSGL